MDPFRFLCTRKAGETVIFTGARRARHPAFGDQIRVPTAFRAATPQYDRWVAAKACCAGAAALIALLAPCRRSLRRGSARLRWISAGCRRAARPRWRTTQQRIKPGLRQPSRRGPPPIGWPLRYRSCRAWEYLVFSLALCHAPPHIRHPPCKRHRSRLDFSQARA